MRSNRTAEFLRYAIVIALLAATFYPILFMLFTSVKSTGSFALNFFLPDLTAIHFDNYMKAAPNVLPYIWNSVKVSVLSVAGILFVGSGSAYIFARFRFPGKEILYQILISMMMIPSILTFVPSYLLMRDLGLLNTHYALILPGIALGLAFAVLLLRTFFESIDQGLIEAARIDGAKEFRILIQLVLPLTIPMISTVGILSILRTWNDFLWPLVTLSKDSLRTLPVGLAFMVDKPGVSQFTVMMAGYTIASVPLIILFLFAMKPFMDGINAGAIKG
ncbi:carbohydrate ABC transporter permease [Paenibacillus nasutitermitis]|uniref:Sugar ABC transporter permease n=1 Tax=Paenibacillus nasutitermitis TaxID=1652958 RepID=A0A916ZCM2_9BACL|nr:carbohydrate ABC transporter permease [Paenibacillus nasutitermitis]GGD88880.1 sugar ABC transporter permease [Paenibacillus nasutitermitis]